MTVAGSLKRKNLFIGGRWQEAEHYIELTSPYNGEVLCEIPSATEAEVEQAIVAATQARGDMKKLAAYQRADILEELSYLLKSRKEEAAQLIALEASKPIATARGEVERTIQTYKFAAEEAKRNHGEMIPLDATPGGQGRVGYTKYEPLGVIGAITPFNFPMNLVAHKVGPAITAGNTIVLKPASQTPLSAYFLAELLEEAGLPAGALNVVTGKGRIVGNQIVEDDRISMITFTGSPEVGKEIRSKAGLKKVTLELGSNAALIVDKDVAIDGIISRCVTGAFSFQGQVCISLQRIYVHEDQYEEFVDRFIEETNQLKLGDPLNEDTDVSALITQGDVTRSLEWIEEAIQGGAKIATGGKSEGNALLPTVLLDVQPAMKVSCQEVFAPIVLIDKITSVEEGIEKVNDSRFGLQAGIYTEQVSTALDAADRLEVGGVIINDFPTFRVDNMPYGGVKESGTGKEGVKYSFEEMSQMKLVVFNRYS
ncbi:aldehyde dehydrogenase family protein [Halobacillus shinanisalinarum]|uniref:Aldehyde dehydrogenase family protein n=1 Tax=Halobacillus shinanisalinarum TaxID=2932258 RepID=A0ABY4GVZ3_9BACI|nr:aldehyde dehydrogenase family protein [Halobacillus shinanisalinarum]UOQ92073.1 aldehyde dehydrogenase family protein [Halobacillus shinanisalinarum]